MKKFFSLAIVAIAMVVISCGGKESKPLVGKWEQKIMENGVDMVATYDFKDNGKCVQTIKIQNESPAMDIDATGTFDYVYENNAIKITFDGQDFEFKKFSMEGLSDDMVKPAMEAMKSQLSSQKQIINDVKIEGDKLTGNFNGTEITMEKM